MKQASKKHYFIYVILFFGIINIAYADNSWISVPSGLSQGQNAELKGAGFDVNKDLILQVTYPDQHSDDIPVLSSSDGKIAYALPLVQTGEYMVRVVDGFNTLAITIIMASE